jgi:hypothetical protein
MVPGGLEKHARTRLVRRRKAHRLTGTIPNPLFGHHPLVGHFEYLAHFLFNHCQIKDTPSGTISEHAPGIF